MAAPAHKSDIEYLRRREILRGIIEEFNLDIDLDETDGLDDPEDMSDGLVPIEPDEYVEEDDLVARCVLVFAQRATIGVPVVVEEH